MEKQKQQLEKLDELLKAKFIEMFGDIFNNTRNFATCPFGKFVNQMNIGPFGSDLKNDCFVDKSKSFCMVYEQKHAIGENINIDVRFINKEKYNKLKRFEVESGDIIVSCRGTIGKCFLLPKNAPKGIIHPSLMMIKPKKTINNNFLLFLLREILSRQNEKGSGVKMAIKATELEKIETINPPKEIQDKYINFVEKIEKIKYRIKKQIDLYTEL